MNVAVTDVVPPAGMLVEPTVIVPVVMALAGPDVSAITINPLATAAAPDHDHDRTTTHGGTAHLAKPASGRITFVHHMVRVRDHVELAIAWHEVKALRQRRQRSFFGSQSARPVDN